MKREDIKDGNWFKKKGSNVATFRFTHILENNKISYNSHFDNYACCEYMVGKGRGIKECVGGNMLDIDHLVNSDEYEAQGDSPNYYEDYDTYAKYHSNCPMCGENIPVFSDGIVACSKCNWNPAAYLSPTNITVLGDNRAEYEPNTFVMGVGKASIKLRENGDILINGRLADNDKEIVDAFKEFVLSTKERYTKS